MSNQQSVIDFIKYDRTLTGARNIYNSLPNKSLSFLASINRMRSTEANIKHVAYQLFKAVGLQERQMLALWGTKVESPPAVEKEEGKAAKVIVLTPDGAASTIAARLLDFNPADAEWKDIQGLAADIAEETETNAEGRKKEDLLAFIQQARENVIVEKSTEVPIEVKRSIKLREQFPFLKEKDCPVILKALVNDLITSYEKYKAGHAKLFDSMTQAEEALLAREIVDNFIDNKQIFDELEHYQKTGQELGAHPAYEQEKIKAELEKLTGEDLNKRHNALRKNISINKKKAEATEDLEAKAGYQNAVDAYTWELEVVKSLLKKK
jgi:hypothetical protein